MKSVCMIFAFILGSQLTLAQLAPPVQTAPPPAEIPPAVVPVLTGAPPPATLLERFGRLTNTVVLRGYTDVAGLKDDDGTAIRVLTVQFTSVKSNEKASGLAIEVHPFRPGEQTVTSLIDE